MASPAGRPRVGTDRATVAEARHGSRHPSNPPDPRGAPGIHLQYLLGRLRQPLSDSNARSTRRHSPDVEPWLRFRTRGVHWMSDRGPDALARPAILASPRSGQQCQRLDLTGLRHHVDRLDRPHREPLTGTAYPDRGTERRRVARQVGQLLRRGIATPRRGPLRRAPARDGFRTTASGRLVTQPLLESALHRDGERCEKSVIPCVRGSSTSGRRPRCGCPRRTPRGESRGRSAKPVRPDAGVEVGEHVCRARRSSPSVRGSWATAPG